MKKRCLLSFSLIGCIFTLYAQRRLAVFSYGKDTADKLPCICIDFFRSVPAGELYGLIGDHFTPKYVTVGYTRFDGKAKGSLSGSTGIGYFGVDNETVSAHHRHFLDAVISEYKNKPLNDDSLYVLQDRAWTYSVLNELGIIDSSANDQLEEYNKAKALFTFRYGLTNVYPETDSTVQPSQTILSKASQVYYNRKYNTTKTAKPDSIQFTDTTIVYQQEKALRTITPHYHDIPIPELEKFSASLKEAIYLYIQDYRIPPEVANFRKRPMDQSGYVLTFSVVNGDIKYIMSFGLGEKEGSGLPGLR
jgi:hypothetical protein